MKRKRYALIDDDVIYDANGPTYVKGKDGSVTRIDMGKEPKVFIGSEANKIWTDLLGKLKG